MQLKDLEIALVKSASGLINKSDRVQEVVKQNKRTDLEENPSEQEDVYEGWSRCKSTMHKYLTRELNKVNITTSEIEMILVTIGDNWSIVLDHMTGLVHEPLI